MFDDLQQIILYVKADSTVGEIVDEYGQSTSVSKAITRGVEALLCLRVLRDGNAYPFEQLSSFVSWDCLLDNDWNIATVPKLRADNENITVVSGVLNPGTDEEKAYTEIRIPLLETDTVELNEAIAGKDDITLGVELCGFAAGRTKPAFVLQFDLPVRNRRGNAGMGSPTPVGDGNYWTTEQTKAYIQQVLEYEFSEDNANWHEVQTVDDVYFRSRFPEGEWSEGYGIPKGKNGNNLVPSASGTLIERDNYDAELKGFVYGVPDESAIYFKLSDVAGDWSEAFSIIQAQGEKGDKGDVGDTGIQGVQGEKGDKGDTGDRGLPGDTGPKGDKGDTGDTGDKGDIGEKGDGVKIDMPGPLAERHIYDDADRGFTYLDTDNNHIYLKLSDDFADWSAPAPGGIQGIKGDKGDTGDVGPQGPRGENVTVEPDFIFTADDVFGGSLVIEGTKTIAQIELYDAMGNGQAVKTGDPDSPVMITTEWVNHRTIIYFGQSDVANGGRIRFAQGISGESLYQMWLSAGNTGTEEDYLNWLRVQGARHDFTDDDLTNKILTINAVMNIVAVADENGSQWQLPQNAVTYTSNSTTIELSGIMAMKNISVISGTWQLILAGGDKGDKGDQGDPGVDGTVTFEELTPTQIAFLKGEKGDKGDKGEAGEQGVQGIQGEQGLQGEAGLKGDQGDQGIQGIKGDKGDTGDAFTYDDFTPTQLDGLKGDKGDKGDDGAQGQQGEKGDAGDNGDSAYDLWIAAGNTGTLADFLAYTNGEKVKVNKQTGTSYTPVLSDAGKIIEMNNAAANSINLPLYSATAFETDMVFAVDRMGTGQTSISCDAAATINGVAGGTIHIFSQYCGVSIRVLSANNWLIQGAFN